MRILLVQTVCGLLHLGFIPVVLCAGKWFNFRLLRNPGLTSVKASSASDCMNLCQSNNTCSALSYQPTSRVCVTSSCNILDLIKTNGWNTFVLDSTYIEGYNVPAPRFEWMLTDTCGSQNNGFAAGPQVNLLSATYAASLSPKAGNAAKFAGNTGSYAKTATDTRVNNVMGSTSLSMMLWVNFASTARWNTLFELVGANRGPLFWMFTNGIWYDLVSSLYTTCSQSCSHLPCTFTPQSNLWYHIAFVYDASDGLFQTYLNSSLVSVYKVGSVSNTQIWNTIYIGFSPYEQSGPLNGRLYCFRMFDIALTAEQVSALADSCSRGKIRLSG